MTVSRPEPVFLFDKPNSAPVTFSLTAAGKALVTFSTIATAPNGGNAFEYLLWVDTAPAVTMPIPATVQAVSGGTPVSTTQLLDLGAGNHLIQVVVRSPNSVPITLTHSHLTALVVQ
jgi:hypothetical protein